MLTYEPSLKAVFIFTSKHFSSFGFNYLGCEEDEDDQSFTMFIRTDRGPMSVKHDCPKGILGFVGYLHANRHIKEWDDTDHSFEGMLSEIREFEGMDIDDDV